MDFLNLHCHEIKIDSFDWRENNFNNQKIIQSNQKFKLDIKPNNYLFAIKCFKCTEFNNDYKSSFLFKIHQFHFFVIKVPKKILSQIIKLNAMNLLNVIIIF